MSHCFIDLGGLNDNFMPALTGTEGLRTIVAAFEGGAANMADGYARASGGLGVCFGIGGPGVLNMTTAFAAARADRIPLVIALMNNRAYGNIYYRASRMGPGPERLTDIPGIDWVGFARSMGAEGERVDRPDDIAAAVGRALGATGPYLLDLHIDKTYPTPVKVWRERQQEWEDND